MQMVLGFIAVIILLLYSIYFINIIKGKPRGFELEILRALADWMIFKGAASKKNIWSMFGGSLLGEAFYFYLTLAYIQNLVMRIFTLILIFLEIFHLMRIAVGLNRFFTGKYLLSQIFNWRVERASATIFFTHSLLVLIVLYYFY